MIKWRADTMNNTISRVECERETAAYIWAWSEFHARYLKELKDQSYSRIFNTWEEARTYLVESRIAERDGLARRLDRSNHHIEKLRALIDPTKET